MMTDICLFPIPDCVTFPGTVFPLHVFEPRYRKMINYCLENEALLGICHTQKKLSAGKQFKDLKEALQCNQATYKHHDIFSAGRCEWVTTTDDGRMYILVHIQARYQAIREIQTLPFLIYECQPFLDQAATTEELAQCHLLKQQLLQRLQSLTKNDSKLRGKFSDEKWHQQSIEVFSVEIFGVLRFPSDIQQHILATDSMLERLTLALQLSNELSYKN